ncbi:MULTISPECIES: ABC transporter permease [Roseburia]|jgi:teichoic acid transport system permease protein|uniref:ABC transporter permease n=1 Tax=Roseburia TaxID=841 RepID=UPI001FA981F5|nr:MULTISPECIES: ABC transporter permease [Roseburia]
MKKRRILVTGLIIIAIILNIYIFMSHETMTLKDVSFNITMTVKDDDTIQVYYSNNDSIRNQVFSENESTSMGVFTTIQPQEFNFSIPADTTYLRLDVGKDDNEITVSKITVSYKNKYLEMKPENIVHICAWNNMEVLNDNATFLAKGADPYIVWDLRSMSFQNIILEEENTPVRIALKFFECILVDLLIGYLLIHLNELIKFIKEIIRDRRLIRQLAHNDFKTRYSASFLGVFWAFVQPFVTILVYWFVFEKGLKAGTQNMGRVSVPFVLFLISGMIPWFFFNDALNGATSALTSYTYLVKKVVFNIDILPIIKVISALYVHLFFIMLSIIIFILYGYGPNIYMIQVLYYTFSLMVLVIGLGYLTSSVVVFFRDLSEIVGILLSIGVWITPIMWNLDTTIKSEIVKKIFEINPLYYIVIGYRDALINHIWFWEKPGLTIYYWIVSVLIFIVGRNIFKKLHVHFADVL